MVVYDLICAVSLVGALLNSPGSLPVAQYSISQSRPHQVIEVTWDRQSGETLTAYTFPKPPSVAENNVSVEGISQDGSTVQLDLVLCQDECTNELPLPSDPTSELDRFARGTLRSSQGDLAENLECKVSLGQS